ncbi:unnamed protein product [uncultured bacterium]|nr:unnamed protein product [uncultured bacterium]
MPLMRALEQAVTPSITTANSDKVPEAFFFSTATADTRGRDASLEIALGSQANGALASTL